MKVPTSSVQPDDTPEGREARRVSQNEIVSTDDADIQFGYDIFKNGNTESFSLTDIPVGPDYILGPGDRLLIHTWGKLDLRIEDSLDQSGKLFIPKVGDLYLAGVRFGQVEALIKRELEKYYVNFDLSVSMGRLRTFKVFVLGDVVSPGSYDVSSLATAFMALYAAGGPTKMGSLRSIELKRAGRTVQVIDLYQYLLKGDRSQDPKLQPLDTIFVPPIGDVAKIGGEVHRQGVYEIRDKTSVYDAVTNLAGGFLHTSYSKRLQLERVVDASKGGRRVVQDLSVENGEGLREKMKTVSLKNGDILKILPISPTRFNVVSVEGNVFRPNKYEFTPGMKLKDAIGNAEGLREGTYMSRVDVYRFVTDKQQEILAVDYTTEEGKNFPLSDRDTIKVYSQNDVFGDPFVRISGPVKRSGNYRLLENMKISDVVFLAGMETYVDLSQGELSRKDEDGKDEIIKFKLADVISSPNSKENLLLKNGDNVFLRYNSMKVKLKHIQLTGEVLYPGTYIVEDGATLSNVLKRAGGFTRRAFLPGAIFKRVSVKEQEALGEQRIFEEEKKRLIYDRSRIDSLSEQSQTAYQDAISFLKERIKENSGRVVIALAPLSEFEKSKDDVVIKDGDTLHIPEIPLAVHVIGGVQHPTSLLFEANRDVNYYIEKTGGFSDFADRGNINVIKPDGSIQRNASNIGTGDSIYVPEKIIFQTNWFDIISKSAQIVFNLATTYEIVHNIH
jgi:protein involved in polysaccharide export with SLBB domain